MLALAGLLVGWEARTFEVGFMTDPVGPKALPALAAVLLFVAGSREFVGGGPGVSGDSVQWPERRVALSLLVAVASFAAYALLLPLLGFFVSTTAVVASLSVLYDGPPKRSVVLGAGLVAALWLLFVWVLALPLPVGSLWIR